MKQEFDPFWFFPSDSYPRAYLDTEEFYFPADGVESAVYMGKLIHYTGWLVLSHDEVIPFLLDSKLV